MIDAGVPVTLNSDDPPFFHTTLGTEYAMAGLNESELRRIARRTIEASFVDDDTKHRLLEKVTP